MTTDSWWDTADYDTAISALVDGLADIGHLPIPYGWLPTRARNNYGTDFVNWSDLSEETIGSLIKRPKGGEATVRAIIDAARKAAAEAHSPAPPDPDPRTAASDLIACLPESDRIMLASRCWSRPPLSQEETAAQLATHGVWVNRHQPRSEARFAELRAEPRFGIVADQAERLRRLLGPVTTEAHITEAISTLGIDADQATADMLVHLAGPYISDGPWLIHEPGDGMAAALAAIERTWNRQPAPSTTDFQNALAAIGVQPDVTAELVAHQPGLRRFGERWVRWGTTKADKAEAVLHLSADHTPATVEMIAAAIGGDYNQRAMRQALHEDPRFARATQYTWALRAWGLHEYTGVFNEIAIRIDAAGGAIAVSEVVDQISTAFPDVAVSSIRTYINALAFEVEHGMVRRRTNSDPWPAIPPLNRTRGAYRNGKNQIRVAFPVSAELLRGSGQSVPRAVAHALSVSPGQERLFTGPMDALVRWRMSSSTGPSMNTLRPLAISLDAALGDSIVVTFDLKTSTLHAARLRDGEALHRQLPILLGRPTPNPVAALARGLDCAPDEVIAVLQRRGDDELAGLLVDDDSALATTLGGG